MEGSSGSPAGPFVRAGMIGTYEPPFRCAVASSMQPPRIGLLVALDFRRSYLACSPQFDAVEASVTEARADIGTRLGDQDVRVRLPSPMRAWTSPEPVSEVTLPWCVCAAAGLVDGVVLACDMETADRKTSFRVGDQRVTYTPTGWEWRKIREAVRVGGEMVP